MGVECKVRMLLRAAPIIMILGTYLDSNSARLTIVHLLHDGYQAVEPASYEGEAGVEHHQIRLVLVHHPHALTAVKPLPSTACVSLKMVHQPHTLTAVKPLHTGRIEVQKWPKPQDS